MSYSVCVVNHNGAGHLAKTLDAVFDQAPLPTEVLLVDSGSGDGSLALVAERYPGIHVIAIAENVGPAAARNAGIDAARHDRILFVDNDVTLAPGCAERLLAALEDFPAAAAAMPRVCYAHDPERVQYSGADAHFTGTMLLHECNTLAGTEERSPRPIGSLVSACFVFDRSRRPGLRFDERFFIYFEDHDFALRARIAGSEILAVESARCYHGLGTAGLSLRATGGYARLRVLCVIRNRWQVLFKCYAFRTLILLVPVLALYELLQVAIVARRGWWAEWFEALRSTLGHAGALARDRGAIQGRRMVSDRALLRGGPLPFADALTTSRFERSVLRIVDGVMAEYWRVIAPVL